MMKAIVSLILFFYSFWAYAQDIEVKKFGSNEKNQTTALSPRKYINGMACGLVKVALKEAGAEFEGNVMGDVQFTGVTYSGNMTGFTINITCPKLESIDLSRRKAILDNVEQLRTALNQKDLSLISNTLMKDNTMNIIGKPVRKRNGSPKLRYKKYSNKRCVRELKRAFRRNTTIKATIDDIEIMRHPVNSNFYGITLLQRIIGDRHQYDGYLFLLWDFTDENAPQIHVRTWQPDKIGGKPLPKDEVFSLSDFDI